MVDVSAQFIPTTYGSGLNPHVRQGLEKWLDNEFRTMMVDALETEDDKAHTLVPRQFNVTVPGGTVCVNVACTAEAATTVEQLADYILEEARPTLERTLSSQMT